MLLSEPLEVSADQLDAPTYPLELEAITNLIETLTDLIEAPTDPLKALTNPL